MTIGAATSAVSVYDVAFGGNSGSWPLPAADTTADMWLRAVAAGGQGRYGSALSDLARLRRHTRHRRWASLALSTQASFLRQLGWHDRARPLDGQAFALSGEDAEAAADALIGLAADALGVGRFPASARALERAADLVTASSTERLPVRLAWVSAELAMVRGDGASAVASAELAVRLAASLGSARHVVKSQVVLAAALCSSGDIAAARREADAALPQTASLGLVPLRWAVASLLTDIGSEQHSRVDLVGFRDMSAETVTIRGGVWRPR
ncbi:MAG: hypothetical protein AB7G47_06205 [Mycolicibacterium sp.]|uniref:hypothetical protein n=1 Tax=Mycolicibacterium sp. TaxID=2320850 RepID=UPI003D10CE43